MQKVYLAIFLGVTAAFLIGTLLLAALYPNNGLEILCLAPCLAGANALAIIGSDCGWVPFRILLCLTSVLSMALPPKFRAECFDPAYSDKEGDYLESRRTCSGLARVFLALCFIASIFLMFSEAMFLGAFDWLRRAMFPRIPRL